MPTHHVDNYQNIVSLMGAPSNEDRALIEKAYSFAAEAHKDQKRFSGEPYLSHLVETAKGLARIGMGAKTIAAGLLHDSVEDVGVSPETIEREFGKEVRFLVEGVTKLGSLKYRGNERHVESLRKLLVATSKDARVLIIKLMDRLHNMQTLSHVPQEKRRRIALETLEIYAAIAHRLGMGVVRRDLEDLAFEYAYPTEHAKTKELLSGHSKETLERLDKMARKLRKSFADNNITDFKTDFRVKGLYSLYRKLQRKGDIDKIYDVAALRIVVPTVEDCYRVLGLVHELWQPLPNKIKDYIAFPKPNGYQSLHTTVFTGDGGIVEIQIRTPQMHAEAEFGIASHVGYKEGAPKQHSSNSRSSSLDWIRSLIPGFRRNGSAEVKLSPNPNKKPRARYYEADTPEWIAELPEEIEEPDLETALKTDIFSRRVFVFTPHGDVVDLPAGAFPIDFAYAIHSDVGDHAAGVKVNGKLVPFNTELHNGDIVQIETRRSAHPSAKWLDFARTTLARRHIRSVLEKDKK